MTDFLPVDPIKIVDYDPSRTMETVRMWRTSMEQALGVKDPHGLDEQAAYLHSLVGKYGIYLALDEIADAVVGLMVLGDTELDQLYVHVDYQGMGVGTRLLNLAKRLSPGRLQCYTFAVNMPAQQFYEKHGFVIIARGAEPNSGMADIRYEWVEERE